MRFLHTADWQLGMTRHFLAGDAQPQYSAARREAVAGLGQLAVETGAEFVVVAGDVFDSNQLAPEVVGKSLQAMRAIGIPVYLLPGNHDPLDAGSVYTSPFFKAECPDNVIVLDREGPWDLRPGVQLVAAPWRSKRPTTDLVAAALEDLPTDGTIRILVAHGGVDSLDPNAESQAIIRLSGVTQAIDGGAVHYVALGDKHSRTRVDDAGRVWYSGSPEVTNYDDREPDPGHVLVVDIAEDHPAHPVTVEARHVGRWRFTTVRRQLDNRLDIDEFDRELDLMPDKERTVVRHGLSGTLTVTDRAALDDCLERHARWFARIGPWERHSDLVVMPAAGEFDDLGLSGFAAAALDELVNTAQTGNSAEAQDAQGALALLLRLVRGSGA